MHMSHNIDKIFYINLDKRDDRRSQIESQLAQYGLQNYERFSAIYKPLNGVGCSESHLAVLKIARDRGYKNILMLEDDFIFTVSKEIMENNLSDLFEKVPDFDVCMLAYNLQHGDPHPEHTFLLHNIEAQTTAGYLVNQSMYQELIDLYEWANPILESTGQHWIYACDQIWKQYQKTKKWYCFHPRIGKQSDGFSDIGNQYVVCEW